MKKQNRVAFFNILSTVLLRGISLFTAPLFSRMLGTNGYGVLSIYTIWMGVTAIAFTLQTNGTLVNARVEYEESQQSKYQSSIMTLSLLFFLLCSAVVILFLPQVSGVLKLSKAGFLFKSTEAIKAAHPELPAFEEFDDLLAAIKGAL